MQYTYDENAGIVQLILDNDNYKHLIKARRQKVGDFLSFRNLKNSFLYNYKIISIDKKSATLELFSSEEKEVEVEKKLHLGWCIVDPKTVEKELPYLNELGVDKITFFSSDYSQKNFKLNFEKLEKILINSSQQCGRSSIIKLESEKSLKEFILKNPEAYMLNFSLKTVDSVKEEINTIIIGCEGGFSKAEIQSFNQEKIVGFKTPLILKSQTAISAVASKIII
ncbi:16S rRNA (uracil(1498)-N(3))-methyltransferase [Malaciobacter mytili]|uniref:16S rRNA (uracil(1498)-N(3))-methyltransferase n=1 Tax=Malaciobacter mytili TaxID=603050 RepID=UPI00100AF577|nr:16S rRNA (uracil(1498)-N(3))-methyltransferase [Malaciobacter mytili]RXI48410.1 16S rRNA (uracil(1498)-N(3))-methyltransferase [Malaciobacter mytili]